MFGLVQDGVVIAVNQTGFMSEKPAVYSEHELISEAQEEQQAVYSEDGELLKEAIPAKEAVYSEPELIAPAEPYQIAEGEIVEADDVRVGQLWDGESLSNPDPDPVTSRDESLQAIVLDLDGDGIRVIQCRPAKFAQDESNMRNAIEKMQRDGVTERLWFMADDTAHMVSVPDLERAIIHGQDESDRIWGEFFLAIQG